MNSGNHAYPHAPARTDDTARIVSRLRAAPLPMSTLHSDAADVIERLAEEVEALTGTASGVWYCRVHSGTVNEDEPHDDDAQCPWHDHDDDRCPDPTDDTDPEYEWCKGQCSPCDWVELLIPAVRRALGGDE